MKNVILAGFALALSICINGFSQQLPGAVNKEKLQAFAGWVGEWQGEGSIQMGPGASKKSAVIEKIESRLDGTILVIEGTGTSLDPAMKPGTIVHHAFAVLSYDATSQEYKFKTYLFDGKSTEAWFKVLGDNKFTWGFDVPSGKIRYNITIDPGKKTWNEVGEFSKDETQWMKFFEMNLTKK